MAHASSHFVRQTLASLLRAPNVKDAFLCRTRGPLAFEPESASTDRKELLWATASLVLPAVKRLALDLANPDEAQSVSLPLADLHMLIFWLLDDYFLAVNYSVPHDPASLPGSATKSCHLLRMCLQASSHADPEELSSMALALETEVFTERQLYFYPKDTAVRPNPHDLSYVEAQQAEVVRTARALLSGELGVVEGSRKLTALQSTLPCDSLDPDFLPFIAIASETDGLPVGNQRDLWALQALAETDAKLREAEERYRARAFAACEALIARFKRSE